MTSFQAGSNVKFSEILEFEVVDNDNPYLPEIPENLDEDIHGVQDHVHDQNEEREKAKEIVNKAYQATVKTPVGNSYEQKVSNLPSPPQKQNIYPLGQPTRPPLKPSRGVRPEQGVSGSLFDFLPTGLTSLWGSSKAPVRPRRPLGHRVTVQLEHAPDYPRGLQAPLLLKVDDPDTDSAPLRPEAQDTPSISSRIDNSVHTEEQEDAFVVLPSQEVRQTVPGEKKSSLANIVPKRPRLPPPAQRFPRPPPPRPLKPRLPSEGPLPMLSQPVIGLPQVPAGRKQAPFLPKRPLLPPQLPKTFPGAPKPKLPVGPLNKKKPYGPPPPPQKKNALKQSLQPKLPTEQRPENKVVVRNPLENFPKKPFVNPKPVSLSPVIARLTQQTKVQDKKPFDFR